LPISFLDEWYFNAKSHLDLVLHSTANSVLISFHAINAVMVRIRGKWGYKLGMGWGLVAYAVVCVAMRFSKASL
jgi:hypothetical protein